MQRMGRTAALTPVTWIKEFKDFLLKGNVFQLAIAIVLGTAFQAIVTSVVKNLFSPIIGLVSINNLENLFVPIKGSQPGVSYGTPEEANKNNVVTLNYGAVLTSTIEFVIIAFFCFLVTKLLIDSINKKKKEEPTTGECAFCYEDVKLKAVVCPHCRCKNPIREMKMSDSANDLPEAPQLENKRRSRSAMREEV